jgi:hypothetical protein
MMGFPLQDMNLIKFATKPKGSSALKAHGLPEKGERRKNHAS